MHRSFRSWSLLWFFILSGLALAVFWSGLQGGYFADDFSYFFKPGPPTPFYFFTHDNPSTQFYRPLQSTFLAVVQGLWGLETLPIHLVTIFCHVVLAWLVAVSTVRLGYSRLQGMIGSIFFLVAQVGTYAVLSNDTLSQVGGVLFGTLAAWLLYFPGRRSDAVAEVKSKRRPTWVVFLSSLLCFAAGLLLKETSTAFLGVIGVALLVANLEQSPRRQALVRTALQLVPFVLLVVGYMIVRTSFVDAPPQFGETRYEMALGLNIPKNILLFLVASATAHSSVTSFVAVQQRDLPMLAMISVPIAIFAGLVGRGLWLLRRDRRVLVLLLLYLLGFFPSILFNHVSEHYLYNSFPFLGALVGIAIGELYGRATGRRAKIALSLAVGLILVINIGAIQSKTAMLNANGERAVELLEMLRPIAQAAPPNVRIGLLNPPDSTIRYSIYSLHEFMLLAAGSPGVERYLGRPDLKFEVYELQNIASAPRGPDSLLVVTLQNGRIVPWRDTVR